MLTDFRHLKRQRGIMGMTDQVFAFMVILAVLVLVFALYIYWQRFEKPEAAALNAHNLGQAAQKQFLPAGSFAQVSTQNLVLMKLPPSGMISGNALVNTWGQPINVTPYTLTTSNDSADITETGVPADDCARLVGDSAQTFPKILVNGTTVLNQTTGTPLNETALASACSGSSNKTVDLIQPLR